MVRQGFQLGTEANRSVFVSGLGRSPPMAAIGSQTTSKKGGDGRIDLEDAIGLLHNRGKLAREGHGLSHMGNVG